MTNRTRVQRRSNDLTRRGAWVLAKPTPETLVGRNIKIDDETGCWIYGPGNGYGTIDIGRKRTTVHRFVYETLVGPVPDDYVVHHWCENPPCCNPRHLEAMSHSDHAKAHGRTVKRTA